jgi:hypothetical protein
MLQDRNQLSTRAPGRGRETGRVLFSLTDAYGTASPQI